MRKLRHRDVEQIARSHIITNSGTRVWTQKVWLQSSVLFPLYQTTSPKSVNCDYGLFAKNLGITKEKRRINHLQPKHLEASTKGIWLYSPAVFINVCFCTGGILFIDYKKIPFYEHSRIYFSISLLMLIWLPRYLYLNILFRMYFLR